jgi:hypothetical protein
MTTQMHKCTESGGYSDCLHPDRLLMGERYGFLVVPFDTQALSAVKTASIIQHATF